MKCPQCEKCSMIVEGLGEGKTKVTCQGCGYNSVVDQFGRRLLTDDLPSSGGRHLILG